MSRKLDNAPVFFVALQADFNSVMALESYAPQIQEKFRRAGFSDTQVEVLPTVDLRASNPDSARAGMLPVLPRTQYVFRNLQCTHGFVLERGSLALQTVEYDVFETFANTFQSGLKALHETVDLAFVDRLGIRYLDAVYPKSNETLSHYLHSTVPGLLEQLGGQAIHAFTESRLRFGTVDVLSRIVLQRGEVLYPPDLTSTPLRIADRFRQYHGAHAILDTDGALEGRMAFDMPRIRDRLNTVHDETERAFYAIATPFAFQAWK